MNGDNPLGDLAGVVQQATEVLAGSTPGTDAGGTSAGELAVLDSNVLPPIPLTGQGTGGLGDAIVRLIRPRVMGNVPLLGPVSVAPYGNPTPGVGTFVFISALLLMGYGALRLTRG